jgi:hypothetical protein
MKKLIFIIFTIPFLTSCIGTKKFTKFVESTLQENKTKEETIPTNLNFDLSGLDSLNKQIVSTKQKSLFIPAILYWQWENIIKCEIDPKTEGNIFIQNFTKYADIFNLQEKLQGRKLDIKIEKIPNSFVYTSKGYSMTFVFAYMVAELEVITPQKQHLVISYKLSENGTAIKEGQVKALNTDYPINNKKKSTKKFTSEYINHFQTNIEKLTEDIVTLLKSDI